MVFKSKTNKPNTKSSIIDKVKTAFGTAQGTYETARVAKGQTTYSVGGKQTAHKRTNPRSSRSDTAKDIISRSDSTSKYSVSQTDADIKAAKLFGSGRSKKSSSASSPIRPPLTAAKRRGY